MTLKKANEFLEQQNTKAYKTAISRSKLSAPVKRLMDKGLLAGRVLDYGCGRGQDADKVGAEKFDPHFFPQKPQGKFDVITCNYVLNVVEPGGEKAILKDIRKRLKPGGVAYITVRRDVKKDGFTKSGTYQRNVELNLPSLFKKSGAYETYKLKA